MKIHKSAASGASHKVDAERPQARAPSHSTSPAAGWTPRAPRGSSGVGTPRDTSDFPLPARPVIARRPRLTAPPVRVGKHQ